MSTVIFKTLWDLGFRGAYFEGYQKIIELGGRKMKSRTKCAMCNETLHRAYFRKGDSDKYCSRHCLKKAFNGVYTLKKDKILGVA